MKDVPTHRKARPTMTDRPKPPDGCATWLDWLVARAEHLGMLYATGAAACEAELAELRRCKVLLRHWASLERDRNPAVGTWQYKLLEDSDAILAAAKAETGEKKP